eukprot:CAMPEP_0184985368 /NCGR_PEP_ID=MMETSP1098-20130426/14080_1 /TAXON_ID=89044 /ORGANISM="Spumella elongata, Strain CCAP 955/1" /LENGTH=1748 /DNA_ID=CAMNT_0027509453 /DNA_START=56 /DNA_END=5302 /DNA_ORIENTATION=+
MSSQLLSRKITGLSAEKWTIHQLKSLQSRMQPTAATESPDLSTAVKDILALFSFGNADSIFANRKVLKSLSAELLSDLIKTLTAVNCSIDSTHSDIDTTKKLSFQLSDEIFATFSEVTANSSTETVVVEAEESTGGLRQASALGILANLGSIGFEESATMLLDSLSSTLANSSDHCDLVKFTVSYLQFLQTVMNFHSNRKKLFTNICEVLLPSVMRLLSHCHAASERGDDSLSALQSMLSDVIGKGLFDEKNVEELATLQLSMDPSSTGTNNNKHVNKKQKSNEPQGDRAETEKAEGAKAKIDTVKNKSFHDTLFRILESRYNAPTAETDVKSVVCTDNIMQFAQSYANGVACLYKVYCTKSASMALQASTSQSSTTGFQPRGSYHANNSARNDVLGTDAVNARKHLIRVFHFLFQLIEAFRVSGERSMDELVAVLEERTRIKKSDAETTATPGKKRKQDKKNTSDAFSEWSVEMVQLLKARILRNAILTACVEIINQQAIPNHDSLYRYVELLVGLSVQSVKDCVRLNAHLESVADAVEVAYPDAEFAHAVLTADLECVRLVALIDHTTVVDHRLPSIVEILGAQDFTGNHTDAARPQWMQRHYAAKRDLFQVVLRVHGELRLLDHLVGQLTKLDGKAATVTRPSMLHTIVSSSQIAQTLVKLFSAAPVGQLPQHWANLSGASTTNGVSVVTEPSKVQVGVLTCALARALMEAQLHSVRSNISVFSAETASIDQVDANTVHMTVLLWRLAGTAQSFVTTQNSGHAKSKGYDVALMQGAMSTLSVLLRFVAHFHAGTMKQLTVPCLQTSADSDKQTSFHNVAMGLLLNNLLALRLDDSCFVPVFKALLSLVLLNSNIAAKVPTAQKDFSAQTTILSKYTLDLLAGAGADFAESTRLDLLYLVLCDIRVWSQFVRMSDATVSSSALSLQSKHLVPLFQVYIRAGRHSDAGTATDGDVAQRVQRIAVILKSPAVTDNKFLRLSAHAALQAEWLAADTTKASKGSDSVASRTVLLASLYRLFGADFLYSATFFAPSIFAHLVAIQKSNSAGSVEGSELAASVLLGHLRIVPSERACSQISAYPAKPSVLDSALYFMTGVVHPTDEIDVKVLGSTLVQLYGLARSAMQQEEGEKEEETGHLLDLVSLLLDVLLSRLVQQFNLDESTVATSAVSSALIFIKEVATGDHSNVKAQKTLFHTALSCFVSTPVRKLENSSVKNVNPSDPLVVSALHEVVATLSQRLLMSTNVAADRPDGDLYCLGEAVVVISAMVQKSDQKNLSDAVQSDVIRAMFQYAATVLRKDVDSSSAGWLYLFGSLSDQILLRFGVVTLPQITEAPTADMYLPITINLSQLGSLCDVMQRMLARELQSSAFAEITAVESTALSMPVVSLLTSLLNAGLNSRVCNCEPHQMLSVLKSHLLQPLQAGSTTARSFAPILCRDVLIYFTEHGRKLLPGGKLAQDKFQQFHESLIELTVSTYQDIIASHRGQTAEDVNQLAALLYHTNCVTATVSSVLQRQGRGGARRKNKENDTKSTLFRCDLWFDGLLSTITLITSHMHMWQESGVTADSTETSALDCNASTVLLAKSLLQNMERLVAVSTSSSLPNLNTAIGAIILAITSTVTLLLRIENAVVASSNPSTSHSPSVASATTQALTLNLNSCYHLICRVFSSIASSQVLEKHVHFIACAAVEGLSKATVSRTFQEVAYPGIYALFEKCLSRQKTQMFAMLDAQSRTLMTDLHNEFMRSFKFVGK